MQIQIGDFLTTEAADALASHYFPDYDVTLRFGFVFRPTPAGTNDGLTLIVAEPFNTSQWRCAHIIGDVWPGGDGASLAPDVFALAKRDDFNLYLLERFGAEPTVPSLPDDFELWAQAVTEVIQDWEVDGNQLVLP